MFAKIKHDFLLAPITQLLYQVEALGRLLDAFLTNAAAIFIYQTLSKGEGSISKLTKIKESNKFRHDRTKSKYLLPFSLNSDNKL